MNTGIVSKIRQYTTLKQRPLSSYPPSCIIPSSTAPLSMISHHLKKQLEEAGFKKLPTLDTLIEACHIRAVSIIRKEHSDGWVVHAIDENMSIGADTIEDCFAILWLGKNMEATRKMNI